eukprot:TRINITY_DN37916_c0_g1_i1.p1 TRINITY_DN37916_c0_g1~~TRINITY_DN37916_c0_g1_i1.p1  ORF type:complete len:345 (+),score=5.84 TRINITY_DN37916_c0_g1_i1:79-1035(+)
MAALPLVRVEASDCEWLQPLEIREAFRIQSRFIRPDLSILSRTVLVTTIPAAAFLNWILPTYLPGTHGCCELSALASVFFLILTSCRNPGVVPRMQRFGDERVKSVPNSVRTLRVNGLLVQRHWCNTCELYRPLRSKHCAKCDRCIFRFDHHCAWIGNCVGLGNYRSFLGLIASSTFFFGQSAWITWKVLRHSVHMMRWHAIWGHRWEIMYFIYASGLFTPLLMLCLYHMIIISCNLTTNEHLKKYYSARPKVGVRNPFDTSVLDNYRQVFCAPYGRVVRVQTPSATALQPADILQECGTCDNSVRVHIAPSTALLAS